MLQDDLPTFAQLREHLGESDTMLRVTEAVAESPALARFLFLSVLSARASGVLREWAEWKWHGLDEEHHIEWSDPATKSRFERAFYAMLHASKDTRRDWKRCGTALEHVQAQIVDGNFHATPRP